MDQYLADLRLGEDDHDDQEGAGDLAASAAAVTKPQAKSKQQPKQQAKQRAKQQAKQATKQSQQKQQQQQQPKQLPKTTPAKVLKRPAAVLKRPAVQVADQGRGDDADDDDEGLPAQEDDQNLEELRDRLKSRRFHAAWDSVPEYVQTAFLQVVWRLVFTIVLCRVSPLAPQGRSTGPHLL